MGRLLQLRPTSRCAAAAGWGKPSRRRYRRRHVAQPTDCPLLLQGCTEALPSPIKVVGMGSSGQDLLAQVCLGDGVLVASCHRCSGCSQLSLAVQLNVLAVQASPSFDLSPPR